MKEIILQTVNFWILLPISYLFRMLLCIIIITVLRRLWVHRTKKNKVSVVVVGDIGRSPRMQYHSLSLANNGFCVNLIGYSDSVPHHTILDSANIQLHFLKETPTFHGIPKVLSYLLKVIFQSIYLLWTFTLHVGANEYILLQNPPCIPSLCVCWLLSLWNGSKLIVDWHNYGYTILGLSLGSSHPLVRVAKWYEEIFGQLCFGHLCVTKAMEKDLMHKWHISAEVMHDRPAAIFKPIDNTTKHKLFLKLASTYSQFKACNSANDESRFTKMVNNDVEMLKDRPALIVSSTSWTEDEDFSILIDALQEYEDEINQQGCSLPNIVCAITGKGPLKSYYQQIISTKDWKHVEIITPWLEAEDYPKLLACADLGVSLHTSSSGLDLPMKVVDMFGCGLPVTAINFSCLDELVQDNVNGLVFDNAEQLCQKFKLAFEKFPHQQILLNKLKKNVQSFRDVSWNDSWNKIVHPLFLQH